MYISVDITILLFHNGAPGKHYLVAVHHGESVPLDAPQLSHHPSHRYQLTGPCLGGEEFRVHNHFLADSILTVKSLELISRYLNIFEESIELCCSLL